MNTLLISYDLISPGKSYQPLWDYLESFAFAKPLRSVYLIKNSQSAEQFRNTLYSNHLLDHNDKVVVVNVTNDSAAWKNLPESVGTWIKSNL
jgi:hypothetical protein